MPSLPTELFRYVPVKPVSKKEPFKCNTTVRFGRNGARDLHISDRHWETHYCFVSTPVKEPANTHPFSSTQSHHTLYNSLWHTKMHTMILVQAHTPTFPPNNLVDAFSLLCQVAFYNCSTMEKLITVDLESWLIDRASVLIASLLPGASEMAVNASHMTSVFWHSEKNTLPKLFTGILVERRHVYLGVFLRSDVFKPLVVVIRRAVL